MEPSQILGVSEECHSSESGWTMYIGSPLPVDDDSSDADDTHTHTDEDVEEEEEEAKNKVFYAYQQDDSDDSMASDASSGPIHQQRHPFGRNGRMKNPNGLKNEVNFSLESKTKKPLMENQRAERKEVKEKLVLVGQKPKSSVQSSSKVRKNIWMGKTN